MLVLPIFHHSFTMQSLMYRYALMPMVLYAAANEAS